MSTTTLRASLDPTMALCSFAGSVKTPGTSSTTSTPGANYGWPHVKPSPRTISTPTPSSEGPGQASRSGIRVADATIFIANLRGEVLRTVPVDDPAISIDCYARIRDVTLSPNRRPLVPH